MKGGFKSSFDWVVGLTIVVLIQQTATVSAVYNMTQTCAQYGNGWIADPSDCAGYGYCNNSLLQGTAKCPDGLVYNARKGVCQEPTANVCSVANVCLTAPDKSHVANPSDCSTYYYCDQKVGTLLSCPTSQIYDQNRIACVWKSQNPNSACVADSICRLIPDGKFAGDPNTCGLYVACINGIGTGGKCPDNTYFNAARGGCQPTNPCLTPTPVGVGLGVETPLPDNPKACKGQPDGNTTFVSDGQTCMGYYICSSPNGPGTWSKCNYNLHFGDGTCGNPCNKKCEFDRCGNMKNQQFMGALNSGCKNYLLCKDQTSISESLTGSPCPAANPYFNEVNQTCLPNSPGSDIYLLCPKINK